jgi:hypothetical protein
MTTLTWVGGGNNKANNPLDWSPNAVPQPGDTLYITGSLNAVPPNGTINVAGNQLAGDTLIAGSVPTHSIVTINLSHDATLNLATLEQGVSVIPQSTTLNLTGDATLTGDTLAAYTTQTINIGHGNLTLDNLATVGPAPNPVYGDSVTVNSSGGALRLLGTASEGPGATIAVNATTIGTGTFDDGGSLTFTNAVAHGITVDIDGGTLVLNQPTRFLANADLTAGVIDLNNLVKANSYTYKNDMLSIYSGGRIIDHLRLTTTAAFTVEETSAGGVSIYTADTQPPVGTALPLHGVVG